MVNEQEMTVSNATSTKEEIWQWSAVEIAKAIRTKQISSREAVLSSLKRIEQVNPKVNALVEVLAEEALEAADAADAAVKNGEQIGPLHGVPVTIKVNTDQAGRATTDGVVSFQDQIAKQDNPVVANLRKAGAIFVGRSNTPAFSFRWFTNNDLHGQTNNPWDAKRTPGGSSGGAAVSVATGMVPIGHGNDIGGSVRYPAYACGVTGIRPTVGRVPSCGISNNDRTLSQQIMGVEGPIARTVADLRLALSSMSDFDPRDPIHVSMPLEGEPLKRPVRVGLLRDPGVAPPNKVVNQALDDAAKRLEDAGYVVEEVSLPLFKEAYQLWYLLVMQEFRQLLPLVEKIGDDRMKKAANHYYAAAEEWWGKTPSLDDFINGYTRRGTLIAQLQTFLEEHPLLLLPISTQQAFVYDEDIESVKSMKRVMDAQWSMMAIPLLGFPAISISTDVVNGLPVGVQLLGRRFREDTLFDAAEIIEAHKKIHTPIDPV